MYCYALSASQKQSGPVSKVDVADAHRLLKNKTTEWDSFGRELGIDLDFREGLRTRRLHHHLMITSWREC